MERAALDDAVQGGDTDTDTTIAEILELVTDSADASDALVNTPKPKPEKPAWQTQYEQERAEREERIKGIRETAMFRTKGMLYTNIGIHDSLMDNETEEDFENRMQTIINNHVPAAYDFYVKACAATLIQRKNTEAKDWKECMDGLYGVHTAVEGIVRSAHGLTYYGG
jgi:hypothetical protein